MEARRFAEGRLKKRFLVSLFTIHIMLPLRSIRVEQSSHLKSPFVAHLAASIGGLVQVSSFFEYVCDLPLTHMVSGSPIIMVGNRQTILKRRIV